MAIKTSKFDAADYLTSQAAIDAYLEAALEENDPAFFQKALGTVARAQGMQDIAGKSQTTRAGLYKALSSEGNPEFATVMRVVNALGYRLAIVQKKKKAGTAKSKMVTPKRVAKTAAKRVTASR
ncbi:addiction module antidote protein [Lysobacter sp. CFH 32150]|uniref:addiction module antidote protein n=1 Tax=Lysobacter sp. CFH 32150 TaxID=2927128 RepID=UPI001FA6CC54|nr:addiction module antidote protein [Lysobacter sp. CFH 32150]MCI4568529.1 putative addiction module antidote protein [Lysobacter sp. CFH 32150]